MDIGIENAKVYFSPTLETEGDKIISINTSKPILNIVFTTIEGTKDHRDVQKFCDNFKGTGDK